VVNYFFLDASALSKRFHIEPGADLVNLLLDRLLSTQPRRLLVSRLGLAETVAALNRYVNSGHLSITLFRQAMAQLAVESEQVDVLPVHDALINHSLPLLLRHNLNASDALFLRQVLDRSAKYASEEDRLVLVVCDRRLLRAAQLEGLPTFNPETDDVTDLERLLG
jgi:predicted nucleic acid-binding protein